MSQSFTLSRSPGGRLVCTLADGTVHANVMPVRAFPLAAPEEGLSILNLESHEIIWVDRLADLPTEIRRLLEEELAGREFMPEISRIESVSSFATPSTWTVRTDRGATAFVLRGEEDIRRLSDGGLLIADNHGILYRIRDRKALDRNSRKILGRFL